MLIAKDDKTIFILDTHTDANKLEILRIVHVWNAYFNRYCIQYWLLAISTRFLEIANKLIFLIIIISINWTLVLTAFMISEFFPKLMTHNQQDCKLLSSSFFKYGLINRSNRWILETKRACKNPISWSYSGQIQLMVRYVNYWFR